MPIVCLRDIFRSTHNKQKRGYKREGCEGQPPLRDFIKIYQRLQTGTAPLTVPFLQSNIH